MPLKNVLKSFPEKIFVNLIDDTPSTEYSATLVARHLRDSEGTPKDAVAPQRESPPQGAGSSALFLLQR